MANGITGKGQCVQLINNPADTIGWIHGSSDPSHPGHYDNDTFVVCNSKGYENNYLYCAAPFTLYGATSTFNMSFDFRIDSNFACSDGLSFWFLTSSLRRLGSPSHVGADKGFCDTTAGFALTFETTGCTDNIYMKKINSNHYSFGNDTDICTPLLHQSFLTDSQWHHCIINYNAGNITTNFDGGSVVLSGYSQISGTGHFGFMGTSGAGYSRKCIKNILLCGIFGWAEDISQPDANKKNAELYPNPATNELTVLADHTFYNDLVIANSVGSNLLTQAITGSNTQINIKSLPPGLYYITLKGNNGTVVRKFVKT